jgi:hypothetical protein
MEGRFNLVIRHPGLMASIASGGGGLLVCYSLAARACSADHAFRGVCESRAKWFMRVSRLREFFAIK